MKRCKHACSESSWITSKEENGEYCEYDIYDDKPHSSKGVWSKCCPGPICNKFYNSSDEQFENRLGFLYCDETKCNDCEFYEPEENGNEIKIKKVRDPIETRLRHEVFKRDKYKCIECSKTKEETTLHCDHIIPVSQGGTDELDNLQTLCQACNLAKSNRKWEGGGND